MVCQGCIRVLKKARQLRPSEWGKHDCWEVDVEPRVEAPTYAFLVTMTDADATMLRAKGYHVARYKEGQ